MKSTPIQRKKKLIAKVYTESEQDKFHRRHLVYLLGIVCGIFFALQSSHTHATNSPHAIDIDVKNRAVDIDYSQVDQFNRAQDIHAVKFAAKDGDKIILSDSPIVLAEKTDPYQPQSLADLGIRINLTDAELSDNLINIPLYQLANDNLQQMPVMSDMIQTAENTTQTTQEPNPTQTVIQSPLHTGVQPDMTMNNSQPHRFANVDIVDNLMFWQIFGVSALLVGFLLLVSNKRSSKSKLKSTIYSGKPDMNKMVGKGKLFDFNGKVLKGRVTPINTTFLNMLWHVGKFTKEGSMNTYFYMAFYIPPQQDYAKTLQKKSEDSDKKSHTEA